MLTNGQIWRTKLGYKHEIIDIRDDRIYTYRVDDGGDWTNEEIVTWTRKQFNDRFVSRL